MSEAKFTRLRRGATLEVYAPGDNIPIGHIDSAFQSQEYIAHLVRQDPHDVQRIVAVPKTAGDDEKGAVDEGSWLFEQLRRLAQDLVCPLITNLQLECTRDTCPEMKAGEWLYLCVAHGNNVGGHVQCCAIDYIVHTLDSATALLNSTRVFPSRLSVPSSSYRHFSSLARRLSRIFAHAFYHHRELFSQAEAESSLYARFLSLSQQHSLVPPELLVIPLEGLQPNHANEHLDTLGGYDHEPGSPQSAIEADGGTFLPGYAHERPAPQSRQLFDDGSTGVDEANEEDIEEPEPSEESGLEEPEPTEPGQHDAHESIEATTTEVHENGGSTEAHKQPNHVEDSAHPDGSLYKILSMFQ
ncbi:hypothetical protein FRC06_006920 [Ceratobasidium sp. 370]|nr:hypothetical protein FRC06_006920 [Ceratobasidium sp. 370]